MSTITETSVLRSAFLKIGWAPLVTIGGSLIIFAITLIIGLNSYDSYHGDGIGLMKMMMILSAAVGLAGYIISYRGFAQAHKVFGITRAGDAFATLKFFFLIYSIIGALYLIVAILLPSSAQTYIDMMDNADHNVKAWASVGILLVVIYIVLTVFGIVSLFVIMNKTAVIAATTNIEAMRSCAAGARYAVYCFFAAIVVFILAAAIDSPALIGICELALLGFGIFILVKWVGGWLEGATEVLRHPVEALDYDTTPAAGE